MNDVIVIGGGQSGLVAAYAARKHGLDPVILEAGTEPVGSWPYYYDSLTLFSPAEYSGLPGMPFPGAPEHHPVRDEVVEHLRRFASALDVDIRTGTRVSSVEVSDGGFLVRTNEGEIYRAAGLVAASGSFGNPYLPSLPGQESFGGTLLHVSQYRNPKAFADQRVVVVGAGNSAVQVGYELAGVADVTLSTRQPVAFVAQRQDGRDLHYWLGRTGFDRLPPEWLARIVRATLVLDTGDYRRALDTGRLDRRPMFEGFDGDRIRWCDGREEPVDTVLLATGYRPDLAYLEPLGALAGGLPQHAGGISTTHPGLVYVGLEFQRSFSSNTLRGAYRDAEYVMPALAAHVRGAGAVVRV